MQRISGIEVQSSTAARSIYNAVVFGSGATVTLGDATKTGKLTFGSGAGVGGTVNLSAGTLNLTTASDVEFDGVVSNGGLTKAGTGTLTLTGANTALADGITVSAGTLKLGNANALGTGLLTLAGGAKIDSSVTNLLNAGNNTQTWNGDFTFVGTQNLELGTGAVSLAPTAGSNINLTVTAGSLTVAGIVSGTSQSLTKLGTGTLSLPSANTYTGATTINAGVLIAAKLAAGGSASSIGASSTDAANLVFGGGTLKNIGGTATLKTTDRLFTIGNASGDTATLDSSGANALNCLSLTNTGAIAFGNTNAHTLTLTGTNIGTSNIFAPLLADAQAITGLTSLVKSGAGTWALTNANTYTGTTTVNAGSLAVNGSSIADANMLVINGGTVGLTGAETVDTLFFGAAQQAAGTYSADGVHFTGAGTLIVSSGPGAGFSSWITTPAFGLAPGDQGITADPDHDGMDNLLEYALNGNPGTSDPSILPDLVVTTTDFEFTYSRLDLSQTDTAQTFEYGTTLSGWTPVLIPAGPGVSTVGIATVTITDAGSTDTIKVSIPKSAAPEGKLFGRLQVVK